MEGSVFDDEVTRLAGRGVGRRVRHFPHIPEGKAQLESCKNQVLSHSTAFPFFLSQCQQVGDELSGASSRVVN